MKILITNHWSGNLGDIAILESMLAHTKKEFPDAQVIIESSHPEITASQFKDYKVVSRIFPVSSINHTISYKSISFVRNNIIFIAKTLIRLINLILFSLLKINVLKSPILYEYRSADLILAAGGDYISKEYAYFFRFAEISFAKSLNKTLVLYSQSIGPFSGFQVLLARHYLSKASLILSRDSKTTELLKDYKVNTTVVELADSVISLKMNPSKKSSLFVKELDLDAARVIGVVVRDINYSGLSTQEYDLYIDSLLNLYKYLTENNFSVVFISPNNSDYHACVDFKKRVGSKSAIFRTSDLMPSEVKFVFSKLFALLSARMHPVIIATTANTPVIAMAKEFKTTSYMEKAGVSDYCIPMGSKDAQLLTETFRKLHANYVSIKNILKEHNLKNTEQSNENIKEVKRAYEKGKH